MPRSLKKIANPQEDMRSFNENFDNISLDMADARGTFSSAITTGALTITAGSRRNIEISVTDVDNKYQSGELPCFLRWSAYVDNDGDSTYLWPLGSNITTTMLATFRMYEQSQYFIYDQVADEKATITLTIGNFDSVDHNFYLYMDVFYLPGPDLGAARRAS